MSLCNGCGMCCYNWVTGDLSTACEYLADDLQTCRIFERWEEFGSGSCRNELTLQQVTSLPSECGYIQAWAAQGLVERGADNRWRLIT